MSEITTGAVSLSLIGAPLVVGTACIGAAYFAGKYCAKQYSKMLKEIEETETKLKWLDKHTVSSPAQMAAEAARLQKMVSTNSQFLQMTEGMSKAQRGIFAGAIATEHSPLRGYVHSLIDQLPESETSFEAALKQGSKKLATDNLNYVNKVVKDAAIATGFAGEVKILKQTESLLDIVFSENGASNRKLTAYCKLDRQMNPSLALDLEGFGCDTNECSVKMGELIKYLQDHGVPFDYKRMKHNQPMGVLRELLDKKQKTNENDDTASYLKNGSNTTRNYFKQK